MSVDTLGMANHRIEIEDIQNFIATAYNKGAKMRTFALSLSEREKGGGTVSFLYTPQESNRAESRILWVWQISSKEDLEIFNREHPEIPERTEEFTYFSLGSWGHGREIVQSILAHFGGGILIPYDCAPENWEEVSSNAPEHRYKVVWDMKDNKMSITNFDGFQESDIAKEPLFVVNPNQVFCSGVFTAREGDNLLQKGKRFFTNLFESKVKEWLERLSEVQLEEV